MRRESKEKLILAVLDLLSIHIGFWVAFYICFKSGLVENKYNPSLSHFIIPSLILSFFWIILYTAFHLYDKPNWEVSRLSELINIFKSNALGLLLIALIFSESLNPFKVSKVVYYSLGLATIISTYSLRTIFREIIFALHRKGVKLRKTAIVGVNDKALHIKKQLDKFPKLGYKVLGLIGSPENEEHSEELDTNILGTLGDLRKILKENNITEIIITKSTQNHNFILNIMDKCSGLTVSFKALPELFDIVAGHKSSEIYEVPLLELFPEPFTLIQKGGKRVMDIAISLFVLTAFLPFWVLVAVAIKIDSEGPIFFTQTRVGKEEKNFKLIKFRSMRKRAEKETGPTWAETNDSRITKVGRVIRRFRIDEIPQMLNVLKGEMSLVGPRPERPHFVEQFKEEIPLYRRRMRVKPGITGWAQVKHKYDESLEDVRQKIKYDLYYIENFSLLFDIKILTKTIWVALIGKGVI